MSRLNRLTFSIPVGFAVAGGVPLAAKADCPAEWSARGGRYVPQHIYALAAWNDGERDHLIIGGDFNAIGSVVATNIAAFDGGGWRKLGAGLDASAGGDTGVRSLTVFEGNLIASGEFRRSGAAALRGVAKWDGESWQPMGTATISANDFTLLNGRLVIGGDAQWSGPPAVQSDCAVWNGVEWEPLGGMLPGEIRAVAGHNLDLIASGIDYAAPGGAEPFILRWDGASWSPLPGSDNVYAYDLISHDGNLIAAGLAPTIDLLPNTVVYWTGNQWDSLGERLIGNAWRLATFEGDLIAIGQHEIPNRPNEHSVVRRWDGAQWSSPQSRSFGFQTELAVEFDGRLAVVGPVSAEPPDGSSNWFDYLLTTDFKTWAPLGTRSDGPILGLANLNGDIIAAGEFTTIEDVPARGLARWNGRTWSEFAGGLPGTASALRVEGDSLIVAGQFTIAESGARNISRLHNGDWQALGAGLSGPAAALARYDGDLMAAGSFLSSGSQTLNFIGRFDGEGWRPLGSGLSSVPAALAAFAGELYVGGFFGRAGDRLVRHLARWDGTRWEAVGVPDGVDGGGTPSDSTGVYALAAYGDELFVGGTFATAGGLPSPHIARWDGAAWHAISGTNASVRSLSVIDGVLYAGGRFTGIGGADATGIATWDGSSWAPIGTGSATAVNAVEKRGNRLLAAGALVAEWLGSPAVLTHTIAEFGCLDAIADVNCDGLLSVGDISAFVIALTDPVQYALDFPTCTIDNADCNGDGVTSVGDIAAFVALLTN